MRVPLDWLREFVDLPEAPEALAERLPMLGLGVERIEGTGGDAVLDLEIASNRPDLLSLIGIAREVGAWQGRDVRVPPDAYTEVDPSAATVTAVEIADAALAPRYIAHVIVDVTVAPSPPQIAARLEAAGIRPINNVVDATNYVMLEWGQPLHAFDLDRLADERIVVRPARDGEGLLTLDGIRRTLDPQMLVIADARRPVALAGIMGGAETEIGAGTRRVLLEAAAFHPASVRRTGRRLGLRTEASTRFERGIDPDGVARAARRAARLIAELAGGRVLRGAVDAYPAPAPRRPITLRLARVPRLLGVAPPPGEVLAILARLGLSVERQGDLVSAEPPVGRRDLEREEDLIEEIARHYGYDRIPEAMPVEVMQQGRRPAGLEAEAAARDALIRAGLTEAVTISLVNGALLERFDLPPDAPWRLVVPLQNPLTTEHDLLRPALLPTLLEAARVNVSRRREAVHLFEIGRIFRREAGQITERRALALVVRGPWAQRVWDQSPDASASTVFHLKGAVEALVGELRVAGLTVEPPEAAEAAGGWRPPTWLHPHRAGAVRLGGVILGFLGELHPAVADRFDLPGRTAVAEVDLEPLLAGADLHPTYAGLPRFPAVRRDVAVVAPIGLSHAVVEAALREAVGSLLESVELFDVYTGPPLPPEMRNLAYAVTVRAADRTLTGEEIEALVGRIHEALPARLPVTIRTSGGRTP